MATTGFMPVGEGYVTGSWNQQWQENGVGPFDHMQLYMLNEAFEDPGILGFGDASWSGVLADPQTVIADGDSVSNLLFTLHYAPAKSQPFSSILTAWNGTTMVDSVQANWSGGGWSYQPVLGGDFTQFQSAPVVPEPITMLGVLLSVGGIGRYVRRRKLA